MMKTLHVITSERNGQEAREGGNIAGVVYYTSPQKLVIRWLTNLGDLHGILIGWIRNLSVQTFQQLIVIYRRVNFVYHYWKCTSIYHQLSSPFRSLSKTS